MHKIKFSIFMLLSGGILFAQPDFSVFYQDKSFDQEKNTFVKNEVTMNQDSFIYIETRYKIDFSDSMSRKLIQTATCKNAFTELKELINNYMKQTAVFTSNNMEFKFNKKTPMFNRMFTIRLNAINYYLYDIPDDNALKDENIDQIEKRKRFETIMKAVEACIVQ